MEKKSNFALNGVYDFDVIPEKEQTVEKFLGIIETGMGVVVKKLQEHKDLTEEDFNTLSMFIISLMNRTPKNMKQFQESIQKIHDMFEKLDYSQSNEYTKEYFNGFEDVSKIRILKTQDIVYASQLLGQKSSGSRLVSFQYFGQFADQIVIAEVVPPLALHQVYHEPVGCATVEFRKPALGKAPDKPGVCAFSIPFT